MTKVKIIKRESSLEIEEAINNFIEQGFCSYLIYELVDIKLNTVNCAGYLHYTAMIIYKTMEEF